MASSPANVITDFGSAWIPCGTEWSWRSIGSPIHPGRFGTEPMIIVDKALARLEAEGRPIRVAVIGAGFQGAAVVRSEEHTSELQSLMRISYAVFCLKKKTRTTEDNKHNYSKVK